MKKTYECEILSPAGNFDKLVTAFHFGADAVYLGGENFGLRAGGKNFSNEEIIKAVQFAHKLKKKIYITVNIYAKNVDFAELGQYVKFLEAAKVDAIIVSDPGVIYFVKKIAPSLEIHLSTQANTTNKFAAKFWAEMGIKRIVLARETSLDEIREIREFLPEDVEIEAFVHGAMCIAYSGRCLLSNFLTSRDGNKGECVQACRWQYEIHEKNKKNKVLTLEEDERGSYILNSRDLNMISNLKELIEAGVKSFKIEGRMKTQYYVGCVTNAYHHMLKAIKEGSYTDELNDIMKNELNKVSHRGYSTGFYFSKEDANVNMETSQPVCSYDFIAQVKKYDGKNKIVEIEQRNRFFEGDALEVLSPKLENLNKIIVVQGMTDENNDQVKDAKLVQQRLFMPCEIELQENDILRRKT